MECTAWLLLCTRWLDIPLIPLTIDSEVRECSKDFTDVDAVLDVEADFESEFLGEMVDVLAGKKSLFNNAILWILKVIKLKRTSNLYIIALLPFLYPHFHMFFFFTF